MTVKYGLLTAEDTNASEFEVYDFLYALVRLLKPKVILETGFYKGGSANAMARAVTENGFGHITSCETDQDLWLAAQESAILEVHNFRGITLVDLIENVDFAFIDSSGHRVEEVRNLQLAPNAVVVLHDSKRPQYRPIWTLRPWKSIWEIETEQGLAVFQS